MNLATAAEFLSEIARLQAIIAAQESKIEQLRAERTPDPNATPTEGTQHSECPYVTGKTTRYCTLTPLTLTDAEREAIAEAIRRLWGFAVSVTLRSLLERTQNGAPDGRETEQL